MIMIADPLPPLGPFPKYIHLGMLQAMMVIMRSMEPGRGKGGKIKYGTARKVRSTFTVLWDISPDSGGDLTFSTSSSKGKYVATRNPAEGRMYQAFAMGCCAQMGDVVQPDRAYTISVLLKLVEMYEEEYSDLRENMPLESLQSCMFLSLTCLGGMRGYEAIWTDLAALRYDVEYCESMLTSLRLLGQLLGGSKPIMVTLGVT